jgi:large subunit ribosomal protein L17
MRHNVKGRKLGRTTEHRNAMFRNQLASLVESGRIVTTLSKAKELRPIAEKVVTKGKRGSVEARRQVYRLIPQRDLVKKLFDEVAPRFQERNGGYLRILKLGPRPGDGAEMALLQWVDYELEGAEKPKGKAGAKAGKAAAAEAPAKPARGKKKAAAEEAAEEKKPAKKAKAKPGAGDEQKPAKRAKRQAEERHKHAPEGAPKKRSTTPRKAGGS